MCWAVKCFLRYKGSVSFTSVIGTNACGRNAKCARPSERLWTERQVCTSIRTPVDGTSSVHVHHTQPFCNWHSIFIQQTPLRALAIVLFTSSKYARIMAGGMKENEIGDTHFPCVIVRRRRLYWSSYGSISRVWRLLLHNYVRHTCQMSETREIRSS